MFFVMFAAPEQGGRTSSPDGTGRSSSACSSSTHVSSAARPSIQCSPSVRPCCSSCCRTRRCCAGGPIARLEQANGGALNPDGSFGGGGGGGGGGGVPELQEVTAANWETLCPPSASTLCAIAFLTGGPNASDTFDAELAAATDAAMAHARDPYNFMWADGNCLLNFADAFDVQPSKLPTVVAFSPKKQRYAGFVGVYGEESIRDLLGGVLSGRVKTKPMSPTVPEDADCAAAHEGEVAMGGAGGGDDGSLREDEEDLGDMMAEILAEEARQKARRKRSKPRLRQPKPKRSCCRGRGTPPPRRRGRRTRRKGEEESQEKKADKSVAIAVAISTKLMKLGTRFLYQDRATIKYDELIVVFGNPRRLQLRRENAAKEHTHYLKPGVVSSTRRKEPYSS